MVLGPAGLWEYTATPTPYSLQDAVRALRWAGGLDTLPDTDRAHFDVAPPGSPDGHVDMRDACRIARKVAGLEANP